MAKLRWTSPAAFLRALAIDPAASPIELAERLSFLSLDLTNRHLRYREIQGDTIISILL